MATLKLRVSNWEFQSTLSLTTSDGLSKFYLSKSYPLQDGQAYLSCRTIAKVLRIWSGRMANTRFSNRFRFRFHGYSSSWEQFIKMLDEYVQWKCPKNIRRTYPMNMPIFSAQTLQCEGTTRMSERSNVRSACCPLPPAVHRHCEWLTGQRRGLSNDIHFEIMKSYTHGHLLAIFVSKSRLVTRRH